MPRVLICENEFLVAMDLQQVLAQLGDLTVDIVTTEDCQRALAETEYSIVVLDISVASDRFKELARAALRYGARPIFMSTNADHERGVEGFEQWPVVIKPFSDDEVVAKISALLDRPMD